MRILVVEDETQIGRVLRMALQSSGHEVTLAANGVEALERYRAAPHDLVLTDLAMPLMDGLELTRALRKLGSTPILVLSVREGEAMKVAALDAGADDYITKPFSMPELLARVRVQQRKLVVPEPVAQRIRQGELLIDADAHTVRLRGTEVHLTPKEFDLLLLFARNPGRVLTHKVLLRAIWGPAGEEQPEYLRVLIAQLRRKLELDGGPRYIQSEPWVGYRFQPGAPTSGQEPPD